MIVLFLAIFGLQIVIWGINTVMLLLPSSGDYFD